jgi:hypothetical protein
MLDSLVRVSRRVNENHFVSIANTQMGPPRSTQPISQHRFPVQKRATTQAKGTTPKRCVLSILNPEPGIAQGTSREPKISQLSSGFLPSSKLMLTHPAQQDTTTLRSTTKRDLTTRRSSHSHADAKDCTGHDWFPSLSS